MKKVIINSLLMATLSILLVGSIQAKEIIKPNETSNLIALRNQVVSMIQEPDLAGHDVEEASATIYFFIGENGQIEIRTIRSDSSYIKEFIQKKIAQQSIDLDNLKKYTLYKLEVNFSLQ